MWPWQYSLAIVASLLCGWMGMHTSLPWAWAYAAMAVVAWSYGLRGLLRWQRPFSRQNRALLHHFVPLVFPTLHTLFYLVGKWMPAGDYLLSFRYVSLPLYLIFEWLVAILLVLLAVHNMGKSRQRAFPRWVVGMAYSIPVFLTAAFYHFIHVVVKDQGIPPDFIYLEHYTAVHWGLVVSILLWWINVFLGQYLVSQWMQHQIPRLKHRLWWIGGVLLSWSLVLGSVYAHINGLAFFLATAILALLMDLYVEKPRNGYIWFIAWLTVFSIFTSALLLSAYHYHRHQKAGFVWQWDSASIPPRHNLNYALVIGDSLQESYGIFSGIRPKYYPHIPSSRYIVKAIRYGDRVHYIGYPTPNVLNGLLLFSIFFMFSFTGFSLLILFNSIVQVLPASLSLKMRLRSSLQERVQVIIISTILFSFLFLGYSSFHIYRLRMQDTHNREAVRDIDYALHVMHLNPEGVSTPEWQNRFLKPMGYHIQYLDTVEALSKIQLQRHPKYGLYYALLHDQQQYIVGALVRSPIGKGYYALRKDVAPSLQYMQPFLSHIISIYVFLFLIAYAIVFALVSSITRPLHTLSKHLKSIRLNKTNEKLSWPNPDEIGQLIQNYNHMVDELQKSAEILAKTERDNAWKEMARQVAHEIKNPLTPMKLSIQYLQNAAKRMDEVQLREMVSKVSSTLIEQIDNLSHIATEFSHFGSMPRAKNSRVVLNDVVISVHNLFRERDDMDIQCYVPIDDIIVFADKDQLIRILNNLLKNAIQAIPPDRRGKITVRLEKRDNKAIISVEDNGVGIPDEMKDKIFEPNFTTKSSGTGLGLALSRSMVESFNGKLYFHSTVGKGTTFYLEIDLMHIKDNFQDENTVVLA